MTIYRNLTAAILALGLGFGAANANADEPKTPTGQEEVNQALCPYLQDDGCLQVSVAEEPKTKCSSSDIKCQQQESIDRLIEMHDPIMAVGLCKLGQSSNDPVIKRAYELNCKLDQSAEKPTEKAPEALSCEKQLKAWDRDADPNKRMCLAGNRFAVYVIAGTTPKMYVFESADDGRGQLTYFEASGAPELPELTRGMIDREFPLYGGFKCDPASLDDVRQRVWDPRWNTALASYNLSQPQVVAVAGEKFCHYLSLIDQAYESQKQMSLQDQLKTLELPEDSQ